MHWVSFKKLSLIAFLFCCSSIPSSYTRAQDKNSQHPPSKNFDLAGWTLSVPIDEDGDSKADNIDEVQLSQGYQHNEYFYTGSDGGMVFKAPIKGAKTSKNTDYTRTELREMLRRGDKSIATRDESGLPNKNNWVFSSAPKKTQKLAGAVDGVLEATLAVNHVTTTGKSSQVGRVIIGQIHAKDDEPIRLYYRKLPNNKRGAIYAAHEPLGKKDQYFDLIGDRHSTDDPKAGFELDEKFSYKIEAKGDWLLVTISDGKRKIRAKQKIDMRKSNYDQPDDFMYFKAGVYNQNKSGSDDDYVQATFYKLKASHKGRKTVRCLQEHLVSSMAS